MLVRVQVKPKVHIGNGLVVDHIPAGLEIENLNIAQGEAMGAVSIAGIDPAAAMADRRIQHVEFRDDRFVASFTTSTANLSYMVRAVAPGTYAHPGPYVEDMYRPAVNARGATGNVVVTAQ